jgi:TPR repeat protein
MNALQGTGIGHDTMKGIDDIRTSAQAGYTPAQTALGYFYDNGVYVSGNTSEAVRWYKKAAETDDAIAEFGLGRAYYAGSGISRDLNEAMKWLGKAADKGLPQAQYLIGRSLETLDYTAAPGAYRKAAEAGFPLAQYRLGLALASGRGIPIDRAEAYVWLMLSFNAHVEAAATPLSELQGALGPDGTEAAKTRAREMESTVTRSANPSGCQGWSGELDEVPTVPPPEIRKFCP